MKKHILAYILLSLVTTGIYAQDTWDLRRCVDYAIANGISVKQADVAQRIAALSTKLYRAQVYPSLSFNTQGGIRLGRSIDPTTNQYTTSNVFFQSYGLSSGVNLFNFFSNRNNIKAAELSEQADKNFLASAQNDISLSVANYYLNYLLSLETANAAKLKMSLTRQQLDNTRKLVDAGSMPELNAAQLEAQMATDSSSYINAKGTAEQNKINLMGALSLDMATPFEVSIPDVGRIPLEPITQLQPGDVYDAARSNQPKQRYDSLNIAAQEYKVKSARGAMYPTLSAFGQLSSNYASTYQNYFQSYSPTGKYDTLGVVPINGNNYYALTPGYTSSVKTSKIGYFKQVGDINFSQAFGVSLNIPIANNRQLRTSYENAKLQLENYRLTRKQDDITLQSNIYLAYSSAVSSLESYNASVKAHKTQQYAYDLAKKRYELGVLSTIDFILTENNLFTAEVNELSARYNYVFRMKILEFYKGQGVRL